MAVGMIIEKRFPTLGRRASTAWPYTWPRSSGPNIDAELEKLAVDPRRSPQADWQCSSRGLVGVFQPETIGRPPRAVLDFPAPVGSETRHDASGQGCPGLTIANASQNFREQPIETNEYHSVDGAEGEFSLEQFAAETLICCRNVQISASSITRDRIRSTNHPTNEPAKIPSLRTIIVRLSIDCQAE